MGQPEIVSPNPSSESAPEPQAPAAVNRLRDKAKALKGPRGKYRCRKCHELPCVCEDSKRSTPAAAQVDKHIPAAPVALFTEKNSARLLEAGFGIPVVLTNCRLWALTEEEAAELSKPAADVLNEFVAVDPKWVSLSILTVSLGSIMARKAVQYSAWKQAMRIHQNPGKPAGDVPPDPPPQPAKSPESSDNSKEGPGPSVSMDMLR